MALTNEQKILIVFNHTKLNPNQESDAEFLQMVMSAVSAIESAACANRDARIAELERQFEEAYNKGWNDCDATHDGP